MGTDLAVRINALPAGGTLYSDDDLPILHPAGHAVRPMDWPQALGEMRGTWPMLDVRRVVRWLGEMHAYTGCEGYGTARAIARAVIDGPWPLPVGHELTEQWRLGAIGAVLAWTEAAHQELMDQVPRRVA